MMIKRFTLALSLILASLSIQGQDYTYMYVNYNPQFTIGDAADFVDEFSWRGFNVDLRIAVNGGLTAGLYSGWTVFREASPGIVSEFVERDDATVTITAKQYRYINSIPLMATVHYHFGEFGGPRPYIGLGTGVYFTTETVEMGLYFVEQKATHFGLKPTAGFSIPMNQDANFNVGVDYNMAFESQKSGNISSIGFNVGFGWRFY